MLSSRRRPACSRQSLIIPENMTKNCTEDDFPPEHLDERGAAQPKKSDKWHVAKESFKAQGPSRLTSIQYTFRD